MAPTVDFTDSNGAQVTIRGDMIRHVARPKGGYKGEVELTTGAKWEFGGTGLDRQASYKRCLAAFEVAQAEKQERQK